jgi:hypothetical protein
MEKKMEKKMETFSPLPAKKGGPAQALLAPTA